MTFLTSPILLMSYKCARTTAQTLMQPLMVLILTILETRLRKEVMYNGHLTDVSSECFSFVKFLQGKRESNRLEGTNMGFLSRSESTSHEYHATVDYIAVHPLYETGDNGGPMMCQMDDGLWYLAGLASWGFGCADPSYPGVYSRITAGNQWIQSTMETGVTSCGTVDSPADCIVSGNNATDGSWPWHVALRIDARDSPGDYIRTCAGVIVDERWVLTEALCVYNNTSWEVLESDRIHMRMGTVTLSETSPNEFSTFVDEVYIHPNYNYDTSDWDLALLYVATPLPVDAYINPVCLPSTGYDYFFPRRRRMCYNPMGAIVRRS
uniref:Transmembrane protease serine 9-like n=1 Tax=Saccoglossus kowalevskii TaxID=10224 RepID=A0ABM0MCQ7_SACKO|nr:PREDICTED: transmembrane protease serine 9-like [Saccoglossus kowalevskii]